jgi:hypothetical protein
MLPLYPTGATEPVAHPSPPPRNTSNRKRAVRAFRARNAGPITTNDASTSNCELKSTVRILRQRRDGCGQAPRWLLGRRAVEKAPDHRTQQCPFYHHSTTSARQPFWSRKPQRLSGLHRRGTAGTDRPCYSEARRSQRCHRGAPLSRLLCPFVAQRRKPRGVFSPKAFAPAPALFPPKRETLRVCSSFLPISHAFTFDPP